MPTNTFGRPVMDVGAAVNRNLGFNLQDAIAQGGNQVMQDVEERRQMGRKKFAEDILQQKLAEASQELDNRRKGYEFNQYKEYYDKLHTPEGQAMWRAFQERTGSPYHGDVTTPEQGRDFMSMSQEAANQDYHNKEVAAHILQQYYPGMDNIYDKDGKVIGQNPPRPEILWARQVLGVGAVSPQPSAPTPGAATPNQAPASPPRSAMGVFMHEALPPLIGTGSAIAASRAAPGGWKVPAGMGAYLAGNRLSSMVQGELSPEEMGTHSTAAAAGNTVGLLGSLLLGGKAYKDAKARPLGAAPSSSGAYASPVTLRKPPLGQRLRSMLTPSQPAPAAPQYSQPQPGAPPSMSNVPVGMSTPSAPPPPMTGASLNMPPGATPTPPTWAPGVKDPRMQAFLNTLFKKRPDPQIQEAVKQFGAQLGGAPQSP